MTRPFVYALLLATLAPLAAQQGLEIAPDELLADAAEARDVAVSRFGTYTAIYDLSEFNTIRLFTEELEQLWKYQLSHYWAGSLPAGSVVAFSPDESQIFFPGYRTDTDVCVCRTETGDAEQVLLGHEHDVSALAVGPRGDMLATVSRSEIVLWRRGADGFEQDIRLDGYEPTIHSISFMPDGTGLVTTATHDRRRLLTLFSIGDRELIATGEFEIQDNNISHEFRHATVTPDGEWIAAGYRDDLYFFRVSRDQLVLEQTQEDIELGTVMTVTSSPDSRFVVSGHFGYLRWWRRDGERWVATDTTATQQPSTLDMAFTPDGRSLFVASSASTNALARFSVSGVDPSPAGRVASALDGDLSAEQRSVLLPAVADRLVTAIGTEQFAPRDMFETADEYAGRRAGVQRELRAALINEITAAYGISGVTGDSQRELEIPLAARGAYSIDDGRYEVALLDSRGWIQIDRDRARSLYRDWEEARVIASVTGERDEQVADFRLRHPATGDEFPLVLERNPFTGDKLDQARTVIPSIRVGPDLIIRDLSLEALLPSLRYSYATQPFGTFTLENAGSGIVSDVSATFRLRGLSTTQRVDLPRSLASGQDVSARLIAALGGEIADYARGGSVSFELEVRYRRGDRTVSEQFQRQLRVLDRNAITWDDDRKIAAFTGDSPELVEIAARVAGSRSQVATTILSREILSAIELFSAMEAYGISYVVDPNSSYAELSGDAGAVDYVRFPVQTLSDRAGDCDDLSVLYASLLESVGVSTAFITTPGHIFIAFESGISPSDAAAVFESDDRYILHDERVWLPVETTVLADGFVRAWQLGAIQWQEAQLARTAGLFTTASAWSVFEPAPQPSGDVPSAPLTLIAEGVREELSRFRELELAPKLARAGDVASDSASLNRQGTLLAAYGLLEEAAGWFRRATAQQEYVPALINLANISSLSGDDDSAQEYLERAARVEPENPRVLLGLAVIYWEAGDREQARNTFDRASALRPALARRFPLFAGAGETEIRAGTGSDLFALDWASP